MAACISLYSGTEESALEVFRRAEWRISGRGIAKGRLTALVLPLLKEAPYVGSPLRPLHSRARVREHALLLACSLGRELDLLPNGRVPAPRQNRTPEKYSQGRHATYTGDVGVQRCGARCRCSDRQYCEASVPNREGDRVEFQGLLGLQRGWLRIGQDPGTQHAAALRSAKGEWTRSVTLLVGERLHDGDGPEEPEHGTTGSG